MGVLLNDSRGFAISLDLLLALIPITLLLGFVAADMDNILFQIEDTVSGVQWIELLVML